MAVTKEGEVIGDLLTNMEKMAYEEEKSALENVLQAFPQTAAQLSRVYFEAKWKIKGVVEECKAINREHKQVLEKLLEPPWYPGQFMRFSATHQKALVKADRKMAIAVHPKLAGDIKNLKAGDEVYLNKDFNCIIALEETSTRSGIIGIFQRYDKGRAVLKGPYDQEIVVDQVGEITETSLKAGDYVIYDLDSRIAYEKIEKKGEEHFLMDTPVVSFEQIGGLDEVIDELLMEIELYVQHQDLAKRHDLQMAKGVLLCGPSGCGKTMVAKAIANYMAKILKIDKPRFMSIKPGVHRSMWYGQTEANIRDIFRVARESSKESGTPTVLFFDELDALGMRTGDAMNTIDSKVLTTFLAEIDGIEEAHDLFLIGATNRADLIDEALIRPGRFGGKLYQIRRPGREAAKEIFRKHLTPKLPYLLNGNPSSSVEKAEEITERAISHIYSPRGEGHVIATIVLRDGKKKPVHAAEVMSGSLIANVVREAKRRSCARGIRGMQEGIVLEDILFAIDCELESIVVRLKKVRGIHNILTDLPDDIDVVRVEIPTRSQNPVGYAYMRDESDL